MEISIELRAALRAMRSTRHSASAWIIASNNGSSLGSRGSVSSPSASTHWNLSNAFVQRSKSNPPLPAMTVKSRATTSFMASASRS